MLKVLIVGYVFMLGLTVTIAVQAGEKGAGRAWGLQPHQSLGKTFSGENFGKKYGQLGNMGNG